MFVEPASAAGAPFSEGEEGPEWLDAMLETVFTEKGLDVDAWNLNLEEDFFLNVEEAGGVSEEQARKKRGRPSSEAGPHINPLYKTQRKTARVTFKCQTGPLLWLPRIFLQILKSREAFFF